MNDQPSGQAGEPDIEGLMDDLCRETCKEIVNRKREHELRSAIVSAFTELRAQLADATARADDMVQRNRVLRDRPDLGDRCRSVDDLYKRLDAAEQSLADHVDACRVLAKRYYIAELLGFDTQWVDKQISTISIDIARAAVEAARKEMP